MHTHYYKPASVLLATAFFLPTISLGQTNDKHWGGDAELGYVSTAGNSETSTLKARSDLRWENGNWRDLIHADALNSSEDDTRSAEKYFLSNKLDYKFNERSYIFGFTSYEHDTFSGFKYQATAAAGLGYTLLQSDTMTWNVEGGPGYRISKVEDDNLEDEDQRETILRLSTKYSWRLSDNATFEQEASVEHGADNTITRSITSLKTTVIGRVAMKLSYTLKSQSNVPVDTKHTDTETAVTLVYSF